ncbi:hypothetical protein EXIGLDRAFT_676002 [Exidia glandulosa HHB12029]|uniref:MYND-type domain-containing protein n=1 Tax=Exidia glandulosa HHB12029 TaxID=1314781 RepID=A0A165H7M6_EXIGL|nr:hypothetical protein EXIGLDRAFT_676002 [Exidia glandulosa HHB12029]
MSTNRPNYGMVAPRVMLDLANRPGFLTKHEGGNRLRKLWNDLMMAQFDIFKWPEFAVDCFLGQHARIAKAIETGSAPDLLATLTDFRISYVTLVVFGSQRTTPLVASAKESMDHAAALKVLLSYGADLSLRAINDATPLHFASAIKGRPDLVRILLAHGADINAQDKYGQTALFDAMLTDELECVEILLEAGADTKIKSADSVSVDIMGPVAPRISAALGRALRKRAGEGEGAFATKACDFCGQRGVPLSICARCHTTRYCSRDCQRTAWKTHKTACVSFSGPATVTIKPTYHSDDLYASLHSTWTAASLARGEMGDKSSKTNRKAKPASKMKFAYPKPMILKIQAPVGASMTTGSMLVYDKRRDFIANLEPSGGRDAYVALRKIIAEKGVAAGLKAYFAAELVSKDELVVKTEVLSPQDF